MRLRDGIIVICHTTRRDTNDIVHVGVMHALACLVCVARPTGEGIAEVEILKWFVKEGDHIGQFQRVCEVQVRARPRAARSWLRSALRISLARKEFSNLCAVLCCAVL